MILTQAQRFVYTLLIVAIATLLVFVLLNVYALDVFIIVLFIELLIVIEVITPSEFTASWRRPLIFFLVTGVVIFAIIAYLRFAAIG